MTERKPSNVNFETWVDQQIREAMERGEFDNLPGAGRPIEDLDRPYDQVWLQRKLHAEGFSTAELLPTPLRLRKEVEQLPAALDRLTTEEQAREHIEDLDARIRAWLRAPTADHHVRLFPLDVETLLSEWRDRHDSTTSSTAGPEPDPGRTGTEHEDRPRWWQRLLGRRAG